jgi:hypothetical protein
MHILIKYPKKIITNVYYPLANNHRQKDQDGMLQAFMTTL